MDKPKTEINDEIALFLKRYLNDDNSLLVKSIIYSLKLLDKDDIENINKISILSKKQIDNNMPLVVAYALNLINIYIYYDLPSMLNNSMRNGHPNIHIYYSEAISRLCMVTLCSLQFEIMSTCFSKNENIFNLFDKYSNKMIKYFDNSDIYNNLNENFDNKCVDIIKNEMNNRLNVVSQSIIESIYVLSNNVDYYEKNKDKLDSIIIY